MEIEILKKKLGTYRNESGAVRKVPDELLMEVLTAWEEWRGKAFGFYTALGISAKGMGSIIKKAKQLKREGFPSGDFKEIRVVDPIGSSTSGLSGCNVIEMTLENGKLLRFGQVDQVIDFLKKAA